MKNLNKLGKALNKAEQKTINGGDVHNLKKEGDYCYSHLEHNGTGWVLVTVCDDGGLN
ncbi:hypothetical protein [Tenacibaculum sp. Bg11-29]|uniref:hypothetical protein n=1 Tax=Tenacibaculum sp. Bg11-29 TaxID=2058306 RepID=UPI0012FEAC5A|nr:hypothetical protein [Tenacibaculum sp. Bg11-29]